MAPSEAELISARLARMKALIADLEQACAEGNGNHEKFLKLKAELEAARKSLNIILPPDAPA